MAALDPKIVYLVAQDALYVCLSDKNKVTELSCLKGTRFLTQT